MEMLVRTGDSGMVLYQGVNDALSCATESELLSEWLPYFSRLKPRHAEEGRSCSSSSSSSSPESLSSASISTLSTGFLDLVEDFSNPWFELRGRGQSRIDDEEEFYRFSAAVDLNLPGDAPFSLLDLFSNSVKTIPDDPIFDPCDLECASEFSTNFDEIQIPTCVTDITALDDDGPNGFGTLDKKFIPLFELDDDSLEDLSDERNTSTGSTNPKTEGGGGGGGNERGVEGGGERRKRGRPRKVKIENPPSINSELRNQRQRRRRRRETARKGHHLWKFIRELLESNEDGGGAEEGEQLVRWENKEKGVFLIVNSREVAELWGKRKSNRTMTYEKLSRSLRWCRSSGFLAEVPKDRKYPKKLCFCFGHRAYDNNGTTTTTTTTKTTATTAPSPLPPPPPTATTTLSRR